MTHNGDLSLLMQPRGSFAVNKIKGQLLANISMRIPKSGDSVVDVSRVDFHTPEGSLRLHGKLAAKKMQFEIQASEIDTSKISELFNTKYQFAGKAYFSADMTLDISDPKVMEMSFATRSCACARWPAASATIFRVVRQDSCQYPADKCIFNINCIIHKYWQAGSGFRHCTENRSFFLISL